MTTLKHRLEVLTKLHGVPFFVEITDKPAHITNPIKWHDVMIKKAKTYGGVHFVFETSGAQKTLAFYAWDAPARSK